MPLPLFPQWAATGQQFGFAGGTFNRIKYCKALIIHYLPAEGIEPTLPKGTRF